LGQRDRKKGIDELQVPDGVTEYEKAQRSDHYIVGLEHQTGFGIDLRLEAYYKDIERLRPRYENLLNTLILLPELQPDRIEIAPEKARARGVELSLTSNIDHPLNWWMSVTWSEFEDKLGGEYIRRSWDQNRAVSGGINWRGDKWNISVAGSWHSGWPTTETELLTIDPEPVVITGPRNDEELGDYKTLDFRISRDYKLAASSLTAFFEVSNIFGKENDCCIEYEVTDEEGEFDLETETNNYLPAIPSIGVIWRFGSKTR
jgi:outer membrane cobalamin receptor